MMGNYPTVDKAAACIIKNYESYAVVQRTINKKLIELLKINAPKHFRCLRLVVVQDSLPQNF